MTRLTRATLFALLVFAGATWGPRLIAGLRTVVPVLGFTAESGCTGACLFYTSFSTTNKSRDGSNNAATCTLSGGGTTACVGWTQDASQWITGGGPCSGYAVNVEAGQQEGVKVSGVNTAGGDCGAVITAANWAAGPGGGRGLMHVRKSGSNSNGSGVRIDLGTTVQEIWFSYGTSWAPGYTWSGGNPSYTKDWDWTASCPNCFIMGHQGGGWGANATGGTNYGGSITWSDIYPGGTSDGSWHCYDYHVSLTTGKLEIWVDGEYSRNTTESFSASFVAFGSVIVENQAVSTFDGYTYYDEIRADTGLSTGQRIGCGASASGGGFGRPRMKLKMKGIGGGVLYALGLGLPFTLEDRKW